MHYAKLIRGKRKAARLTQRQVAEAVGVQPQQICRIESGTRTASEALVVRLAVLFGDDPVAALRTYEVRKKKKARSASLAKRASEPETEATANGCSPFAIASTSASLPQAGVGAQGAV